MDLEHNTADSELAERIVEGRAVVSRQVSFFREHFGKVASEWKADASRVTAVDFAISRNITNDLRKAFSDDDIFSEEMKPEGNPYARAHRYSWVLDPVDGTNNYALGIPICAISLGLLRDGLPVYGFVYDFIRNHLIEGGPGLGVKDGEGLARVRTASPTGQSIVGLHSPVESSLAPRLARLLADFKVRALGSSTLQLAYVANGLFDGVVDFNVRVWDIAAAHALCLGSGAAVHYLNGDVFPLETFDLNGPRIQFCAGNPAMCERLRELLR